MTDQLQEANFILSQIALRSFMDGSKNFCKMPIVLRNQVDEYLRKYCNEAPTEPAGSTP